MPRLCPIDPALPALIQAQDGVVAREQALTHGLTPRAIAYRLAAGHWGLLLPDVYLTHPGGTNRRQLLVAALLYAGPSAAIDAVDACHFHGVHACRPDPHRVHVVVPWGAPVRSHGFVVVRRTTRPFDIETTDRLRYLEAAAAVVATARSLDQPRQVIALMSDAVQRGIVDYQALLCAHLNGPPRRARLTDQALLQLRAGIRSAPEAAFRELAEASRVLPPLLYNPLLRLPNGRLISPDALDIDAAVVHETNGRVAHAREDLFEDMQERHDAMTAAGLVVLHNAPRRIAEHGYAVIAEFEKCHALYAGRGLPAGVELVGLAA